MNYLQIFQDDQSIYFLLTNNLQLFNLISNLLENENTNKTIKFK